MTKFRSKFKEIFDQMNESDASEQIQDPVIAQAAQRAQKTPAKSKDPNFTPVTIYLRKSTYQDVQIRLLAMGRRREVSDLVGELLVAWLNENKNAEV